MKTVPKKVRDDVLWQKVYLLVLRMYQVIDDMIANFPSEEWNIASKLRSSSNDSLFYTSLAVGSIAPDMSKFELNNARKNLFALQAMYTLATKQKVTDIEPELIIEIDTILKDLDDRISKSDIAAKKREQEELAPWLEKYRLWQKMQD